IDGVGEFGVGRRIGDILAGIVVPPANHRPAVICAGLRNVELVPAARAELGLPQLAGLGMDGGALRIAVAVGPNLWTGVCAADEGIGLRDRSIRVAAHALAEVIGKILGRGEGEALAEGDEQLAVRREDEARTEMVAALHLWLLAEYHLDAVEAALAEFPARHRGGGATLAWFGIGEINEVVRLEVGVDRHIEQSSLPHGNDLRHA